ncbi:prolyl oligopeptidase family protein [Chitinimonas sp.]|uniref:prolyl oligopeptidase family serine peptidase n=1 Tax=Chitinimonas sp. TaxID=1934313 RepID=UPI0035B4E7CB
MKRQAITVLAALLAGSSLLCAAEALSYPTTRKVDQVDNYFGTSVADPYRWLEDDNAADTKAWVVEQNKLTFGQLEQIPFRPAVLNRIKTIANYAKYSAPFQKNGYIYFYKNDGLQNQSVLYVQKGEQGKPEILLDPNTFSADGTVKLTSFAISKDGRYAAYGRTAIPGSDWHDIYVMDLRTRKTLPEVIRWAKYSDASWRGDGFYYSRFPEPPKDKVLTARNEHQKVYYHKIGTPQSADVLVHEDPKNPTFYVSVSVTEDERFAILTEQDPNKRGNTLAVRDERKGEKAFRPIIAEFSEDSFSVIDNEGDKLFIETNRKAPNKKVMVYDPRHPAESEWTTLIPEQPELLEYLNTAGDKLFAVYLKDVTAHAYVYNRQGKREHEIALPGPGSVGGLGGLKSDKRTYYTFSSQNYPATIFKYELASKKASLFRAPEIPGFKSDDYESHQLFFQSRDGTRVPMFIVHKKGLKLDGKNPTILYGYGGFNVTLNPTFSATRVAWLEQGGVYAMVNLRGGGEYGETWHQAGTKLNKQNVFDDCIAAAETLIKQGYTSASHLALQGGSNGGLLVGAVINQRPDLFRVAIPQVGVMDMLRFQKFSAGTGWVADYGSSDNEAEFKYLLGYSPLHTIKAGVSYPATLVTTSDHDDRVVPAHSFKYIATLQEKAAPTSPYLIRIATNSGHGASNLTKNLEEAADIYSFAWRNMGFTPKY